MHGTDAVESHISALRDRFGEFLVETLVRSMPPENVDAAIEDVRASEVADARTWVERDGAVLLVRGRSAPDVWLEPGGTVEPGEACWVAARRETAEETGVECRPTHVRGAVRHVLRDETDESRAAVLLQVYFGAAYEAGDLDVQESEIVEARWWSSVPDEFTSEVGVPDGFRG